MAVRQVLLLPYKQDNPLLATVHLTAALQQRASKYCPGQELLLIGTQICSLFPAEAAAGPHGKAAACLHTDLPNCVPSIAPTQVPC